MQILTVTKNKDTFEVLTKGKMYAQILFDNNNIDASLVTEKESWRIERDSDKNIVLKQKHQNLFTLKFDYIWGGAEIIADGTDTGFDVKGRWFKPGTRLINAEDEDLIIALKKGEGLEVTVLDDELSPAMVLATIYYHIYTSAGKMIFVLAGSALR